LIGYDRWRRPENLLRLGIFLAVIGTASAAILLRNHIALQQAGYLGVALTALLASSSMVLPVPALATVCAASTFLVPLYVGLVAGGAETVGELTGYFLGYSGRGVVGEGRVSQRLGTWMRLRGWLLLFLLAFIPNPVFDLAGVTAGALRYPVERFLAVVFTGKILKFVGFAYACAFSADWLVRFFPLGQ
jgi:membrane protein YqaA with SNARE-associated domain